MTTENIPQGIAILGIMIGFGLTNDYLLLLFMLLPILTWVYIPDDLTNEYNNYALKTKELKIEILKEELKLLKARKR